MTAVLSDVETTVDASRKERLRTKITQVIASKHGYPIVFNPSAASPVPAEVRSMTKGTLTEAKFVASTHKLANYLLEQQVGSVSPGLLCVIDATSKGQAAVIISKLEREAGAQLKLSGSPGRKTFSMAVLQDLVLTDGTRLFKSAMFVRIGSNDDDFIATACDNQLSVTSSSDLAQFWMRFLGCSFLVDPRVATQRFFESTLRFVNTHVTDPVVKSEIYEHLQSQMKSQQRRFVPGQFVENFMPQPYQSAFRAHLKAEDIPMHAFVKDVSDIGTRLQRVAYETNKGAIVTAPADQDIIEVREETILVKDSVKKVK